MIAGRPAEILRQLEAPAVPERELLSRFVRERDQAAFAELVRRHGPVVLCVCKRVTGHQQDAEDAFQAVFLLLARKAAAIAQPDLLGNWLYGVAVRISQTARRSAKRRRAREVVVRVMPELATSRNKEIAELNPILDEELTALPSWYREAIVLCDLRGVSREEAARVLGVPEGTLSSRLANGRKKLAARLAKRGIAISVAAVPTTLSTTQAATVPAELFAKTCSLVADWAAGGTIPKPLAKLIQGGITVRKTLLFGLLTAAVAASGVVYGTQSPETTLPVDPPRPSVVAARTEAAEQPAPETKPGDKSVTYTSKPKLQDSIDIELHGNLVVLWNMQGTRIAIRGTRYLGNLPGTPLPGGAIPNPPDTRREQAAVAVFPIPAIAAKESISP
ncbi:MAG TPA: RNA polymerase sigma factor, partial [Gemmata sp.]|nr:RNA polymerase sigma factor [Gemmata sp.]